MTYRPLPQFLEIRNSEIEGHGLFTKKDLPAGLELGIAHVKDERFENGYVRTPLGGFFNHSEDPNCEAYIDGDFIMLKTIKRIEQNEELTAIYWLYELGEKNDN